ncbi:hypothetical protein HBI26_241910 [Parastagonospora nodorum]|nr:hypothetical protein HBI06_248070 [Parastagonospora nodorum]KAH5552743.1 hypothetical protein HBI26_241910 [Parastagonospora nodorum]KAH5751539.1 hypothetical protein HBI16_250250 [Parastagonospora nodorum]KAH6481344.1 hypothetical protein HBI55_243150 [Parastagonospora nodorum]
MFKWNAEIAIIASYPYFATAACKPASLGLQAMCACVPAVSPHRGLKQFLKLKDPLANYRQDRYKVAENIASTLREDPTCVEDKETEEESREKARQRSFMRAKRQNEPLRRTTVLPASSGNPRHHRERSPRRDGEAHSYQGPCSPLGPKAKRFFTLLSSPVLAPERSHGEKRRTKQLNDT